MKLLDDLLMLLKTVFSKLVPPTCKADALTCTIEDYLDPRAYLGYQFEGKVADMKSKGLLSQIEESNMRHRCQSFLICLFKQLKQRLPENLTVLKNVSLFSVSNVLQPVKDLEKYCEVMEYLAIPKSIIGRAVSQLQSIYTVKWKYTAETEKFWAEVEDFKDASGHNPFSELFERAKQASILPH